jgi:hypothetical protein
MFASYGYLHYDDSEGFRLTLKVSQDLSDYYRALIPPYHRVGKQGWAAHFTVVRPEFDAPIHLQHWGKHQNERIDFIYSPLLESGKGFYWFNGWSKGLEAVREELGLINISKYPLIPDGYKKTFHCTVGRYTDVPDDSVAPEK